MTFLRILPCCVLTLALGANVEPASDRVALACLVEGKVAVGAGARKSVALDPFSWVATGSGVTTEEGGRVVFVFTGGERWELGGKSQAVVDTKGLKAGKGTLRCLEPVPMIPTMGQVKVREAKGRPGAFTVRGEGKGALKAVHPGEGDQVLAEEAALRFQSSTPAGRYRVDIDDSQGNSVFSVETRESEVQVSPGILKGGALYFWRVKALDGARALSAEISFQTVPDAHAQTRMKLKAEVDRTQDPAARRRLEAMDLWLGLSK